MRVEEGKAPSPGPLRFLRLIHQGSIGLGDGIYGNPGALAGYDGSVRQP